MIIILLILIYSILIFDVSISACFKPTFCIAGSVFVTSQAIGTAIKLGYTLIACGSDVAFLASGSSEKVKQLRHGMNTTFEHKNKSEQASIY